MSDFMAGLLTGTIVAGVVRVSFGRLIIYEAGRGWVWQWSRFDERQQEIEDRVNAALEIGAASERSLQARLRAERGEIQ
jgi:hypothetical protein